MTRRNWFRFGPWAMGVATLVMVLVGIGWWALDYSSRLADERIARQYEGYARLNADGRTYTLGVDSGDFRTLRLDDYEILRGMSGLCCLALDSAEHGDWPAIGRLSQLESLTYHYGVPWKVDRFNPLPDIPSDEDVLHLTGLTNLRRLVLHCVSYARLRSIPYMAPLGARGLVALRAMPRLQRLTVGSRDLDAAACQEIGRVKSLVSLELAGPLTDDALHALASLENLRDLVLKGRFSDAGLEALARLENLEVLGLDSEQLSGEGLAQLARLPKLRVLRFGGKSGAEGGTLAALRDFPALEILDLSFPERTRRNRTAPVPGAADDVLLGTLGELPVLKSLSLRSTTVTDAGLAALGGLRVLEELDLEDTGITEVGLAHLRDLDHLRLVAFGAVWGANAVPISDAHKKALASLPSLQHARLGGKAYQVSEGSLRSQAIPGWGIPKATSAFSWSRSLD